MSEEAEMIQSISLEDTKALAEFIGEFRYAVRLPGEPFRASYPPEEFLTTRERCPATFGASLKEGSIP